MSVVPLRVSEPVEGRVVHADHNRLNLGVVIQRLPSAFTSDAALLKATPRAAGVVAVVRVDPHDAGAQVLRHAMRTRDVPAPYRATQPEPRVIRELEGLGFVGERDDSHARAEDLLLEARHVRLDVADHCGLDEVALLDRRALPAAQQLGALRLGGADELEHEVELPLGDERAHLSVQVHRVAEPNAARLCHQPAHKVIVQALVDEDALRRDARLSARDEGAKRHAVHSCLQLGVFEHHHCSVAAKLSRDVREVTRGCRRSDRARLGASSHVKLCDVRVLRECLASDGAQAVDHIEHAVGQPRLL
mmetsp:Transcript_8764/g.21650  ORF Transcript_8764/g.21650 Transcript_8764/m.21650 type:complete len:305 (-) Transcript_8764:347-1261(-)